MKYVVVAILLLVFVLLSACIIVFLALNCIDIYNSMKDEAEFKNTYMKGRNKNE